MSWNVTEYTPSSGAYDAVVCGGGPAGCAAALAAARAGLMVLFVEEEVR